MISQGVAELLAALGLAKSHGRPHVSNDNPYSESQFKTVKYQPGFPDRFGSYEHALTTCQRLFPWYNHEHHHSGIAHLTPADVHHGRAHEVLEGRGRVLEAAYEAHTPRDSSTAFLRPAGCPRKSGSTRRRSPAAERRMLRRLVMEVSHPH